MRLIDADKIGLTDFEIVMCNGYYKKALTMLLDKISNQPTAYEINKVVEELNEAKTISVDIGFGTIIDTIRKDVVLEIVKQGCTSDDCCEWKYDEHFEFAKSDCGSMDTHRIDFRKLKYCPYCGKKIKVVE